MGNLGWINGDIDELGGEMVKVMNSEEYKEWREPKVVFLRKRDKVQFLGGLSVFIIGATITVASVLECVESLVLGFLVAMAGAIVLLTSRLCMKV